MKKYLLLAIPAILLSLLTQAQDIPSSHPQPDSIIRLIPAGTGRNSYYLYTIGGRLVTTDEVRIRLASYAPSAQEYTLAKKNLTCAWISFGGFTVSSLGAVLEYVHNNKHRDLCHREKSRKKGVT